MSDSIDRYDIDRLRSIADWLASFPNDDYKDDALFIEDVISKIVVAQKPAAWLVQHPKYMPESCVEIASSDYHDHGLMETQKAQGWVFTPLFSGNITGGDSGGEV